MLWAIPGGTEQHGVLEDDDGEVQPNREAMFNMCASFRGGSLSLGSLPPFGGEAFRFFVDDYHYKFTYFDPQQKGAAF